jgi:hypothetical protein
MAKVTAKKADVELDAGVEETGEVVSEDGKKSDSKKGFKVQDSNGQIMPHSYKTLEEAEGAAKVYGGKVIK